MSHGLNNDTPRTRYYSKPRPDCTTCPHLIVGTYPQVPVCAVLSNFAYPCPVRAREDARKKKPLPDVMEGWL